MRKYLPTQPARTRKGELRTKDDILLDYIQRTDRGLEGFVRNASERDPENMRREITVNRRAPITRNWFLGNVFNYFAL